MSLTTRGPNAPGRSQAPSATRAAGESMLSGNRPTAMGAPRRNRSWGLVVLAAMLVLGSGLAVAAWGLHAGDKTSVLEVGTAVAKGQTVDRADLVSVAVSGVADSIPVDQIDEVVGKRAAVDLVTGQILSSAMVTDNPIPAKGQAVIGLSLDPSAVPGAGLDDGDVVDVIAVPGNEGDTGSVAGSGDGSTTSALDAPAVLSNAAEVYAVQGRSTSGGQVLVTLIVDAADAARVAAYSTQGRVALVETAATDSSETQPDTASSGAGASSAGSSGAGSSGAGSSGGRQ